MKKVFVHRYKWGHEALRKKYRRMLKDGTALLLEKSREGWLYGVKQSTGEMKGQP